MDSEPTLLPIEAAKALVFWRRGHSTHEIAMMLKVSEAEVYNGLGRIREMLRNGTPIEEGLRQTQIWHTLQGYDYKAHTTLESRRRTPRPRKG